jgi:hypothetical protein
MIFKKFEDLSVPITEIYKNLNYKNISTQNKINEILQKKKLIHVFDEEIDDFILYSLNYYDNLNNFIVFGYNKSQAYKYYEENMKNDYSLYGIKHINVSSNIIIKIMYQLLFSRMIIHTKHDLINFIEANNQFIHKYDKEFINITVLMVCKKDLNKKYPSTDIITNDFYIYIPNTKESIWNSACVFFSQSTMEFLEKQNFDYFLTKDMESSKKMFLKYRSWLNDNINGKDQMQFMLFSSIVLYLIGNRAMNDLDLYIHTIPDEIQEQLNEFKTNSMYSYIEYKVKGTDNWPTYWNTWLDEWARKSGAKYFEEILGNPKYHFYFLGVKVISLHCDITRRLERKRPRAIADLIALRKRYNIPINIPPIENKKIVYISIKDKSKEEIQQYIDKGAKICETNNELSIEEDNDINKTINTIIFALTTRYRMSFTENDIKRELNMECDLNENMKNINIDKKRIKVFIKKN